MNFAEYKKEIIATAKLAYPVSIGQAGYVMLGVVDSIMVGELGAEHLAASSLCNGIFFTIMVLGLGMSMAVTPLISIAIGADERYKCGIILRQGLLVNISFALILAVLTFLTSEFLQYMGQPDDVRIISESYLRILGLSVIPFMIFLVYRNFLEGLSLTKPAMVVALLSNIVNFFGNWLLIKGNLGFPALGLDGAGYSTLAVRIFMPLALMVYIFRKGKFSEYDPGLKFKSINIPVIRKIISIGWPSALQYFFEVAAFSFSAIIIGWIGANSLAAHQIAMNLASISYMTILGVSTAGTIRVGNSFGAKNLHSINIAGYTAFLMGGAIMAAAALIFVLFNDFLPTIYIDDPEVIRIASTLLVVAAIFQISDGIQGVGMGVLRGLTDVKLPMYIALIAYWIIGVPFGYLLGFVYDLGARGVWFGFLAGLTFSAIVFVARFRRLTRTELW